MSTATKASFDAPSAPAAVASDANAKPLKMRDLERQTGVGREAIRFYLREGLLPEPTRPARNVAHYTQEHVVRIRAIKRLQEDERLPLAEIRAVLDDGDAGAIAEGRGPELARLMSELLGEGGDGDHRLPDVVAAGVAEAEVRAMHEAGVVSLRDGERLDDLDARLCTIWGKVNALGIDDDHGFGADFLRAMQTHVEAIAHDQTERFMAELGLEGGGEDAARLAAEGLLLSRELIEIMQLRAVLRTLRARRPGAEA